MQLINELKNMQFSEAEAKVYTTLLRHGGSTGYEISKHSGVPRSKIYNHIEGLVGKGVLEAFNDGKTTYYKAISPEELVKLTRRSVNNTLESFEYLASNLPRQEENSGIWEIEDYNRLVLKALDIIENAQESLYIQIWTNELDPEITAAINRKISQLDKTVIILYDREQKYKTELKKFYPHGFEVERLEDMKHRWITVVADEESFLYSAILFNNEVSGIYSRNKILSFFAREYVQHDAYCVRLIDKFHHEIVAEYGESMDGIRNIFE